MQKMTLTLLLLFAIASCRQHFTIPATYDYGMGGLELSLDSNYNTLDTIHNRITSMRFYNLTNDSFPKFKGLSYFHSWLPDSIITAMKFTYLPSVPLVMTFFGSGRDSIGNFARFDINQALSFQPVFSGTDTIKNLLTVREFGNPNYSDLKLRYKEDDIDFDSLASAYNFYLRQLNRKPSVFFSDYPY